MILFFLIVSYIMYIVHGVLNLFTAAYCRTEYSPSHPSQHPYTLYILFVLRIPYDH